MEGEELLTQLSKDSSQKTNNCCKGEQPTANHHFKIPSLKPQFLCLAQNILANILFIFFLEMLPNWIIILLLTVSIRLRKYGMGK